MFEISETLRDLIHPSTPLFPPESMLTVRIRLGWNKRYRGEGTFLDWKIFQCYVIRLKGLDISRDILLLLLLLSRIFFSRQLFTLVTNFSPSSKSWMALFWRTPWSRCWPQRNNRQFEINFAHYERPPSYFYPFRPKFGRTLQTALLPRLVNRESSLTWLANTVRSPP